MGFNSGFKGLNKMSDKCKEGRILFFIWRIYILNHKNETYT